MTAELCRDIAFEAARRARSVNPHELWAAMEEIDTRAGRTVVDLWSEPAVWWAWWSLGCHVIAVTERPISPIRGFEARYPSGVDVVYGDPRLPVTRHAVSDLAGAGSIDVLVLGGPDSEDGVRANWQEYAPMVRPRGLVLVHGIANEQYPGIRRFWSAVDVPGRKELVGSNNPDGYGVVEIHGRELSSHG